MGSTLNRTWGNSYRRNNQSPFISLPDVYNGLYPFGTSYSGHGRNVTLSPPWQNNRAARDYMVSVLDPVKREDFIHHVAAAVKPDADGDKAVPRLDCIILRDFV